MFIVNPGLRTTEVGVMRGLVGFRPTRYSARCGAEAARTGSERDNLGGSQRVSLVLPSCADAASRFAKADGEIYHRLKTLYVRKLQSLAM